jgi:hypothetical protein
MVFAKIAMNRRFLSIFTNSKHLRFWHSHLLNRSGRRKKSFNNSIRINNTKNFQVRAIDKASCIIEDMALPITRSSSIAFNLDNSSFKSIFLNQRSYKKTVANRTHKTFIEDGLK